jgi:hypothetical protein
MCVGRENEKWDTIHGEVDGNGDAVYHPKVSGSAQATAFNVVSIDRKKKRIYAHTFGAGSKDREFYYGEEVITSYPVTTTLNNCTGASGNTTSIDVGGTVTLTFTANDGYELSDTASVSGASYTWDKATGMLVLSNPTDDVYVTITAVETTPTNLLDMTGRTLYSSYTEGTIDPATAHHEMDYTKVYAVHYTDNKRGTSATSKFSGLTTTENSFSATCSSGSGYRLEVPVNVEGSKTYTLTVNSDAAKYNIYLLKYKSGDTVTRDSTTTLLSNAVGLNTATFTAESGYLYSIVFPFGSGARAYTDVSLVEN